MRLETHRMKKSDDTNQARSDVPTDQKIEAYSYPFVLTPEEILVEVGQIFAEGFLRIFLKTSDAATSV